MSYDIQRVKIIATSLVFWVDAVKHWSKVVDEEQPDDDLKAFRSRMLDAAQTNFNYYLAELKAFRELE